VKAQVAEAVSPVGHDAGLPDLHAAPQVPRLGRGVIVAADASAPDDWGDAARLVVDDGVVRDSAESLLHLQDAWARRSPVVIDLRCDVDELRAPETEDAPPHALSPRFEFARERLYFLARANNYDNRHGRMVWGPAVEATRLGATASDDADVTLPDGTPAWLDGGPRAGTLEVPPGHVHIHRNAIEHGLLTPDRAATTSAALAPDQLEAVLHEAGPARVIAPAGSGKTRVLTERFRLLISRGWAPQSITAVAYNVRAKDTMRERLGDVPRHALNRVRTLHSLGNDILRTANGNATLLDEWDVRRHVEALVEVRPKANTDVYAPYLEALSEVRMGLVDPHAVEMKRDDVDGLGAMFDAYRDALRRSNAIDHDEQIYGAIEALLRNVDVRRHFQKECRHLLVDEFQDLTPAQLLMLRLVAAPAYDVFGVGDDDQVIYGYAGADPEFLINYDRYFPGGTHHALATNYRCAPPVVTAARHLLSYNRRRIDKEIVAAKPADDGDPLTTTRTPPEQLALAAIQQTTTWFEQGAQPDDVAVLSRVNASLLPVQILFGEANVPCWTPVSVAVLNRTGTRTALAYLRLALAANTGAGFHGGDLATAIRRPSRSIRREILQRIERRRQWTMSQLRDVGRTLNESAGNKFDLFCHDLNKLGHAIDKGATTADLLTRIRDEIELGAALATLDLSGKSPDASHRDDLNALISVASFEPDPVAFEPWLRNRLRNPNGRASDEGVALSTVHRVKGMEWPYLVVLGAHDGLMPHVLATDLEEERRIFHVAITRADTAVHIVADAKAPAPFLDELRAPAPANYVAPTTPRKRTVEKAALPTPTGDLAKLVDALKAWRRQRAQADSVPAYIVLSDTHLAGIATQAPQTLDDLARCPGIGPTKLERYGDEIIAVVSDA
jgi:DNA helicase-2/ATP-dependent DNA helicase PcrA